MNEERNEINEVEETDEVWGRTETRFQYEPTAGTFILINGSNIPIEPGVSFRELVGEQALNAGFNKYRVLLNGEEIRPSQAPALINEGDRVEIRSYDVAG
jgi:hypothetical protein